MLEVLEKYHQDGLLLKQTHPVHDLTIWNYSPKVQYETLWDEITIQCRGLVTNSKGDIIARPFKKFFNYEEHTSEEIPNESFEVFDKLDGSLGILFHYNNEWILATRGSFTSDQAVKGKEILSKYNVNLLFTDCTYLLEIIYPENRIVVQYNDEKLVLLSIIHTQTGTESRYEDMILSTIPSNIPFVKRYDAIDDYSTLKSLIPNDAEGFVIRFKNGFRMKIKGDEYVRLHRILTNISNRNIWEYLKDNKPLDEILEKVPDEFYDWVKKTVKDFEDRFEEILGEVITDYWEIVDLIFKEEISLGEDMIYDDREYSKKFAECAKTKKYPHLLFSYKKEVLYPIRTINAIWLKLYPDYSKPFKNEREN